MVQLVEDANRIYGATYKGVQTGTFGKYNTISFNGNKIITGSAGGCFLTDDEEEETKFVNGLHRREKMSHGISMKNLVITTA